MPPKKTEKSRASELNKMRVDELSQALQERQLSPKRNKELKASLVARLLEAMEKEDANDTSTDDKPAIQEDDDNEKDGELEAVVPIEGSEDQTQANASNEQEPSESATVANDAPVIAKAAEPVQELAQEKVQEPLPQEKSEPQREPVPVPQQAPESEKTQAVSNEKKESPMAVDAEQGSKRKRSDETDVKEIVEKRPKAAAENTASNLEPPSQTQKSEEEQSTKGSAICIKGFIRPLQTKRLEELISRCGQFTKYWVDKIRTHCYVIYSDANSANEAMEKINGSIFQENGKVLEVVLLTPVQAESLIDIEKPREEARNTVRDWERLIDDVINGRGSPSVANSPSVTPTRRLDLSLINQQLQKGTSPVARESRYIQAQPAHDGKSLDERFHKTTTEPPLYFLPLSDEEAEQRLKSLTSERVH